MKIAILGPAYPLRGGIAHYLALVYQAAIERGHEVFFAAFEKQYPEHLPDWPILRKLKFPGSGQAEGGEETVHVDSTPLFVPWSPRSWLRTADRITAAGAEVAILKWWIPFFGPGYAAVAWQLARRKIPTIAILDNVTPHEGWPLGRFITRTGLRAMHGFIAQSDSVRRDLMTLLPATDEARVRLVHHPTYDFGPGRATTREEARRQLGIVDDEVILFFGFIKPYKGLMVLIEAVPRLRELLGERFRVLVVGDFYEDPAPYYRRIEELGIADRLTLEAGYLPSAKVADYFRAADVLALPYVTATQSGIVQIAYRYDRPVVTTRVGGMPEFIDDGRTGYLVPPNDPDALAGALVRYLREDDHHAFAAAIADKRRSYSWEALVDAVVELAAR